MTESAGVKSDARVGTGLDAITPSTPSVSRSSVDERRRFLRRLAIITVLGFGIRLSYILFVRRNHVVWGDAFFYHQGANLLADGKGFIAPLQHAFGHTVQAADHPPLYLLFLSLPSSIGLRTSLDHLLWSAFLGTGTIVVTGFLGRRVAGNRVGLVAAALAAVYPNLWLHDGALLSETMAIFVATLALLLAYRAYERPTLGRMAALGAACGAAALARSELVLLLPALLLPIALIARPRVWRDRLRRLGLGALVAVAVIAPWVGYNLSRFEHPVFLSSQFEPTLAGANCRDTYSGPSLGFLTPTCLSGLDLNVDESVNNQKLRDRTTRFVRAHLSQVPVVVGARIGRVVGVFRPAQQLDLESFIEGRERWVAILAMIGYYAIAIGAIAGGVVLRRQRAVPLFPLLVVPAVVIVSVAVTYGSTRFRAPAETSLVVLAAVAIDAIWTRVAPGRAR